MSEIEKEKKPWSRGRKILTVLLGIVIVCVGVYFYRDKPAKLVQTTDITQEVDYKRGEIVDYHFAFNAAQDERLSPAEENGWRLILQALGPRALEQVALANEVPWEEFPTNEKSKEWFEGTWTFLCEKFNLDPREKPTMFDRLYFWDYLAKNGLKGDEEPNEEKHWFYYENGERFPAKIGWSDALEALAGRPWTAEEYPAAARAIEEYADLYDVFARAARSPRLGCWHFVPEAKDGGFICTLLPDVQFTRDIARLCQIRACYRVGMGDISGAIDDVETATLFGRACLESEYGCLVERLVGLACISIATGIPVFENPDVAPTQEEIARLVELRSSLFRNGAMKGSADRALSGESFVCGGGAYADYLASRRLGVPAWKLTEPDQGPDSLFEAAACWFFLDAPPVNDAKSLKIFKEYYEKALEHGPDFIEDEASRGNIWKFMTSSPERNNALYAISLLVPAVEAADGAFKRNECVLKISVITAAITAYRAEHGTLPPAFTVDENGKPLQSWRVLILPYLGDDAKALYEKIRLDEPWDSEYNAAFHAQVPDVFRCPSATDLKEGETIYSVLLGDEGLFDESGVGKDLKETVSLPGRDVWRQFFVVERSKPVCWMAPDQELKIADFTVDEKTDMKNFYENRRHVGGMNYSNPGGSGRFVSEADRYEEFISLLRGLPKPPKKSEADAELPVEDEPATEEPTAEEPTADEPAVEEVAVEEPVAEESAAEEPAAEEPAAEEPAVEEPTVEEPVAEEPAVDEPTIEEPAVEAPVVEEPTESADVPL